MGAATVPSPAVFIVSDAVQEAAGDDETDKSLLFACTPDPRTSSCITVYKGLSLAVRGVLGSICGEKTNTIQLRPQQGTTTILAFAHLQKCMVVLALPNTIPPDLASHLTMHMVHVLVMLAGPSNAWLVPDLTVRSSQPIVLKPRVKVLLELVCTKVLAQIEGAGWARVAASLSVGGAVLRVQLDQDRQNALHALLAAHQAGGGGGSLIDPPAPPLPSSHMPIPAQPPAPQYPGTFQFYRRHCCLLHKGLLVASGLAAHHTQMVWQLCWCLQLLAAQPAAECRVITHQVHLGTREWAQQDGEAACGSQRGLLVLVAARATVLAVMLAAYDEEIEDELAGKLEGQAAVELLQQVHNAFGPELDAAVSASCLLRSIAQPPQAGAAGSGSVDEGADTPPAAKSRRWGRVGGGSVFSRLLLSRAQSRERGGGEGGEHGADGGTPRSREGMARGNSKARDLHLTRLSASTRGAPTLPPALLLHHPASCTLTLLSGDLPTPNPAFAADVWATISEVRAHFGRGQQLAVAPPPKHSRLCLTLGQIERQAAVRAPREGGQRLGSADSAPWQYHPELASLAAVQQVTLQLHTAVGSGVIPWFVTGRHLAGGGCLLCVHSSDTDEGEVLEVAAREYEGAG